MTQDPHRRDDIFAGDSEEPTAEGGGEVGPGSAVGHGIGAERGTCPAHGVGAAHGVDSDCDASNVDGNAADRPAPSQRVDAAEFECLFRDKNSWLCKLLRGLGARPQETEDLAQQVLVNLLASSTPLSQIRSPNDYIRRIAARLIWEVRRKARREQEHVVVDSELAGVAGDSTSNARADEQHLLEQREELARIAAPFSKAELMVLYLTMEGFSAREMAEKTGQSLDKIERRLTKVNERLESIKSQRRNRES